MADYDAGDITERERLAADRQKEIARFNADSTRRQLANQLESYDVANQQNRALADVQLRQNSRKGEADRFEAQRNLQNAAIGLLGSIGPAMNGSATYNFLRMLENRNDADNQTYWGQLQQNNNTVNNAYEESYNQNQLGKMEAVSNAEKILSDYAADLAANLSNINPNLYVAPGTGDADFSAGSVKSDNDVQPNLARLSGYLMPDDSVQVARQQYPRNRVLRNDYFGNLMNRFNGRQ